MLKIRVMPTLLFKDIGLVKDRNFTSQRRIGAPLQAIKVYNMRDVDELVFLDVGATPGGRPPDFAMIDDLADECFMPLTVGGGVRHVEDIRALLRVGADKVAINSAAVDDPAGVRASSTAPNASASPRASTSSTMTTASARTRHTARSTVHERDVR